MQVKCIYDHTFNTLLCTPSQNVNVIGLRQTNNVELEIHSVPEGTQHSYPETTNVSTKIKTETTFKLLLTSWCKADLFIFLQTKQKRG